MSWVPPAQESKVTGYQVFVNGQVKASATASQTKVSREGQGRGERGRIGGRGRRGRGWRRRRRGGEGGEEREEREERRMIGRTSSI